jgi:hypothetical protein
MPPGLLAERYGSRLTEAHRQALEDNSPLADPGDFVNACLACCRAHFDPAGLESEIEQLEQEHTALMHRWADLPTPRAKEQARSELAKLEARMAELEGQQQDSAGVVEQHYREMKDLQQAITDAKLAMQSGAGERALRQRAVIQRIECTFTATGNRGGGPGKANTKLVAVTIYPVDGSEVTYDARDVLQPVKVHSL